MEWTKLFRLYNVRMLKRHHLLYGFVILSVIMASCISLSIPQIISRTERILTNQVAEVNGAGLKVEAPYVTPAFREALEKLAGSGVAVHTRSVYSVIFQNGDNQGFADMLVGDYGLGADEVILSAGLARDLKVDKGDTTVVNARSYRIVGVEQLALGIDGQSELLGYGKVSSFDGMIRAPFTTLFLLDPPDSDSLKQELMELEPGLKYSTVNDQRDKLQGKLDTNAAMLNILQTLSYMMTLTSVLSCIFMIIMYRQRDIAVIRMLAISKKSVRGALRSELSMLLLPPVLIGSLLSVPLAGRLSALYGATDSPADLAVWRIAGSGTLLFLIIYWVFICVATMAVEIIHPLLVTRGDGISWKSTRRRIVNLSAGFTLLTLVIYAIYLGRISAMISSLLIVCFVGLFFVVGMLLIKAGSWWPYRNRLLLYVSRNVRAERHRFAVTVLSLALTILFMLIGVTLGQTIRDSFNKDVEEKLGYNYMAVAGDATGLEQALRKTLDVSGYTKIYALDGVLSVSEKRPFPVQLCELKPDEYQAKYKLLEGEDIFDGAAEEVLISAEFRDQAELAIGDFLKMDINEKQQEFRIKGIYEAGGMNQSYILKSAVGQPAGRVMFLVQADSTTFKEGLDKVFTLHVTLMGDYLAKMLNSFLLVFKWLCGVCIFSSILFNLNLVYMSYLQNYRETVVIRAIGIGKDFLLRYTVVKAVISLALSLFLSLGLYTVLVKIALSSFMHIEVKIAAGTLLLPIGSAIILVVTIFLLPFKLYRRAKGVEELRAQV